MKKTKNKLKKAEKNKGKRWIEFKSINIGNRTEPYYPNEDEMLSSPLYNYANLSDSEKLIYDKIK